MSSSLIDAGAPSDALSDEDLTAILDHQDQLIGAGQDALVDVIFAAYDSGEPQVVPAAVLGRKRNKTVGHTPKEFPALANDLDIGWCQYGIPEGGSKRNLQALVLPGDLLFADTTVGAVIANLRVSAFHQSPLAGLVHGEAQVVSRLARLLHDLGSGRTLLDALGIDAVPGTIHADVLDAASRSLPATAHTMAGLPSLPSMHTETDLVVSWTDAVTNRARFAVVEAKQRDAQRFSTAQLSRSRAVLAAKLLDRGLLTTPTGGRDAATACEIATWQLHGTPDGKLKLYDFAIGEDVFLDRTLKGVLTIDDE